MAARGHNSLWLAEISKIFFSDTTWRMELKIVMNDHCKLQTKCCYFLDWLKIQDGHQQGGYYGPWQPYWITDRIKSNNNLIRTLSGTFLPSMVPIHPVVLEKKFVLHIFHRANGTKRGRNVHLHGLTKCCYFRYDRLSNMAARGHKSLW
jgi:hypothetical protein